MIQPQVFDEIELLRRYRTQRSFSDAQLATDMTAIGWSWTESYLGQLFKGTKKPGTEQREFIRNFLAIKYYWLELAP